MTDQTKDEIRIVQEINKAKTYEHKKSENQKRHELFINARSKMDKIANAYNKAANEEFKKLYKEKWFKLVKQYANKL